MAAAAPLLPTSGSPLSRGHTAGNKGTSGSSHNVGPASRLSGRNFREKHSPIVTPASVLDEAGDQAHQRVLRTPRVFQSSGAGAYKGRKTELRAHLLPSIMRTPAELASVANQLPTEVDGEFYRLYQEKMVQRAVEESKVNVFLEHDSSHNQPDTDPQQMVAASCTAFQDLVSDRLKNFRRPKDGAVDTSSDLPFAYPGQSVDIAELSDILTLDVERCEPSFKGTTKRPGFTSFQLAARVPLLVHDPTAPHGDQAKLKSQQLPNDVHVIRLDLQPGEVRHVAYSLDSPAFKQTKLASRMSALVSPEEGILAGVIKTLRSKESDVKAVTSVLNDVLRDLPSGIESDSPHLDVEATDAASRAKRLEALTAQPRQTLNRLLGALSTLSSLMAPLMPSIAHALDRVALISVKEIDRLAARCHKDYEELYDKWAQAEKERLRMSELMDRLSGKADSSGGDALRAKAGALEAELASQERLYSNLLQDEARQQQIAEEAARMAHSLRARVKDLEGTVEKLRKDRQNAGGSISTSADAGSDPMTAQVAKAVLGEDTQMKRQTSQESKLTSRVGTKPGGRSKTAASPTRDRDTLLSFAVHKGTQTDTEFFFSEDPPLADELEFKTYNEILRTTARLYHSLGRYEWNTIKTTFLLTPSDHSFDDHRDIAMLSVGKVLASKPQSRGTAKNEHSAKDTLLEVSLLKQKIDYAIRLANESQLEDVIVRLQEVSRTPFEEWMRNFTQEISDLPNDDDPLTPAKLYDTFLGVIDTRAMQVKVKKLESSLAILAPMSDSSGVSNLMGETSADAQFWKRVIRAAKEAPKKQEKAEIKELLGRRSSITDEDKVMSIFETRMEIVDILNAVMVNSDVTIDENRAFLSKPSSTELLQASIKTFYLKKTGRSKLVEISAINLVRAVFTFAHGDPEVSMFALMCGLLTPDKLEHARPIFSRDVGIGLDLSLLEALPAQTATAMATFLIAFQDARHSLMKQVGHDGTEYNAESLGLQTCLGVGETVTSKSQYAATYFEQMVLGFAQFSSDGDGPSSATECDDSSASAEGSAARDDLSSQQMLFVSHTLAAYAKRQTRHIEGMEEEEEEQAMESQLKLIWKNISSEASSINSMRLALGLGAVTSTVSIAKVSEVLIEKKITHLPKEVIVRALLRSRNLDIDKDPHAAQFDEEAFLNLGLACSKDKAGVEVTCNDEKLIWAALWAVAYERSHEMALIGELFDLFDESGDGWFQFDEFTEFFFALCPELTQAEAGEIFLSVAHDGDMTKEVLLDVVQKQAIKANVDFLEKLANDKRNCTYGEATDA